MLDFSPWYGRALYFARGCPVYRSGAGVMQACADPASQGMLYGEFVKQVTPSWRRPLQFSYSKALDNKIYIAKQQKSLDGQAARGRMEAVLGVFTDIGTYPPKPPPLVELQRNPPGLRFFLCFRCGGAAFCRKMVNDAVFSINRCGGNRSGFLSVVCSGRCGADPAAQPKAPSTLPLLRKAAKVLWYTRRATFPESFALGARVLCRAHSSLKCHAVSAELAVCAIPGLLTAVKAGVAAAVIDLASLRNRDAFFNERILRGPE